MRDAVLDCGFPLCSFLPFSRVQHAVRTPFGCSRMKKRFHSPRSFNRETSVANSWGTAPRRQGARYQQAASYQHGIGLPWKMDSWDRLTAQRGRLARALISPVGSGILGDFCCLSAPPVALRVFPLRAGSSETDTQQKGMHAQMMATGKMHNTSSSYITTCCAALK